MSPDARMLTVEDELKWRQNFARLIPSHLAIHDLAATAAEAATRMRKFYYDLVLLDLAMDVGDPSNRDNRPIQDYLSTRPEGTRYFIVSAHIMAKETADAAFRRGAAWVFFKGDLDPGELLEKTSAAIAEAASHRGEAINVARRKLLPDEILEHNIFVALKTGAMDVYPILDTLFRTVAPVAQHAARPHFDVVGNCVFALFWSRRKGTAVSAVLSHESVNEAAASNGLAAWLGFGTRGPTLVDTTNHHVRVRAFEEPTVSDESFDLPVIKISA